MYVWGDIMKLAFIGTGKIVAEALDAARLPEIEYTAIFARPKSRERAEIYARDYGIAKVYTDYDALLADGEIEFVYIGLINSVHYEYAKRALLAGKNVIVEKPFCPTAGETRELIELALAKGLYLFDAVSFLYMPTFHFLQEALPRLGKIKLVQANYSQYSSRYDNYRRGVVQPAFDPEAYGGALYDINFYNVTLMVALFGAPRSHTYHANGGFNGVDTSGSLVMHYHDFIAVCTGAKDSASPCFFIVQGEEGYLCVKGQPNTMPQVELVLRSGDVTGRKNVTAEHRLTAEFRAFARMYADGDYAAMREKLKITEAVVSILERSRDSALKARGQ